MLLGCSDAHNFYQPLGLRQLDVLWWDTRGKWQHKMLEALQALPQTPLTATVARAGAQPAGSHSIHASLSAAKESKVVR